MARNKHNTPGIVKFSFWRMTAENPRAVYACVNLGTIEKKLVLRNRLCGNE